jgi:hypothetical protein
MLAEVTQYLKQMPLNPGQAASSTSVPEYSPSSSQDTEKEKYTLVPGDSPAREVPTVCHEKNDTGKTAEVWSLTTTCGIILTVCGFLLGIFGRIVAILIVFCVVLKAYFACVSWLENIHK